MGGLAELLRPPPHRGPLIAAGTVALAVGIALEEARLRHAFGLGVHAAILLAAGALGYWLGIQAPNEAGRPPAYQTVLLVSGLAGLYAGLLTLADSFGMHVTQPPDSGFILPSLLVGAAALWAAFRRASAVCLLIAAVLGGLAVVATWAWLFDETGNQLRWLLLLMAVALVLVSLGLREPAPRHAQQLVNAAGLAAVTIGASAISLADGLVLSGFWQAVLLAAGLGLLAFAALERAPGPAYLGVAVLALFVAAAAHDSHTLYWWPLVLLAAGGAMVAAGLRPRRPLPPEPPAYKAGDAPLAARAQDDEMVFRVRDD